MEYLTLNNGVQMPLIGFGTFMLGGEACKNAVTVAIKNGYRMIDTAEAYGNEKEVGEGIKQGGIDRKELFLVTKVNFKSYENAEQTVMQSLSNLQTDYITCCSCTGRLPTIMGHGALLKSCMPKERLGQLVFPTLSQTSFLI